ncbi:MAG: DNA polymerase [Hydrogenophaga sp.]|uniref:DNA polymerase n=1 Tax=Hydrogenophaga sp. TaxID=1904254 RepID=UPI00271DDE7A|nr:DNA polymerase [Hydrogenophaga sp.]MDO9506841.1 DNA polymerase [Hydrogenophaga sp.]MDP3625104.1 DNA polymerase [Hydrogenophaga sp.]
MIDFEWKLLLFLKDFTGRGSDTFYWLADDQLHETSAKEIVDFPGVVVCHDFWLIRDVLFDQTQDLPKALIDLDEFRMSTSGNPENRISRERVDITDELGRYEVKSDVSSTYKSMFLRGTLFNADIAREVARALSKMFEELCVVAAENGELARYMGVEVPVYHLLQKAMSSGITIDSSHLSEKRKEAEYDYYFCLKSYSEKHDLPLETPTRQMIEERVNEFGFDLGGVSLEYVLEFLPHKNDFGNDTLALWNLDAAKRVLSSLTLSSNQTRPIVDVFGSRTSRIHLRNPALQNMPKKYRSIVAARKGSNLCYVDYDQYEVGIMAGLSEDPELIALYCAGDMYDLFSTSHLGIAGNRQMAKQLFLSYAYGMSRKALIDAAAALGADRERAKAAFRLFSAYEEWKKTICARFLKEGRIETIRGNHFKRNGQGQLSAKERRSAVSQVVQGTASLIFKMALLEVSTLEDVTIILPMHDALLFEHRLKETPARVVKAFEKVMTEQLLGRINGKASIGQFSPT